MVRRTQKNSEYDPLHELIEEWDTAKGRAEETMQWLLTNLKKLKTTKERESFSSEAQARIRRIYEDVRRRSDFLINQLTEKIETSATFREKS